MRYKFDNFELDTDKFELTQDGNTIHVEPLVFDLIHYLITNPDRIISRDEIIETVWKGRIVSDTTISTCIKSARKALGDSGENQKYIKTLRGRGIEFTGDVSPKTQKSEPQAETSKEETVPFSDRKIAFIIIGLLTIIIGLLLFNQNSKTTDEEPIKAQTSDHPYTIAVMPFVDMSESGDQGYFGNGIAEEILNLLVSVDDIKVTSRTSAFAIDQQNMSIPEIASQLGVNYILEGSVRRVENRVRITAQLIEAQSDTHLWSESFDRELDDIFLIQDEISHAITDALKIELASPDIERTNPTNNMEAYTLYLQGHQLFLNRGLDNIEKAIELFEKALELDPNFAESWADLSASYTVITSYGSAIDDQLAQEKALEAANKAIELKPGLAEAWAVKGYINIKLLNRAEARDNLERAVALNPENETAWMWLGTSYTASGFFDRANIAYSNAVRIAPMSALNHGNLGRNKLMMDDYDGARLSIETSLMMGWWPASIERAVVALNDKDPDMVVAEYRNVLQKVGQQTNDNLDDYVKAYFDPSLKEGAQVLLQDDLDNKMMQAIIGSLLLLDGESFIRYVDENNLDTITTMAHLFRPPFRPMLNQPSVKDYLNRIGLPQYWRETAWPEFCRPVGNTDFECQ